MRRLVFVLVAVSALVFAACGSDDGGGTTGATASTGATAATGSDARDGGAAATGPTSNKGCEDLTGEGAVFTLKISFSNYHPDCFTASASQGIEIMNRDDIDHTFTIEGTQVDVPVAAGETFNGEPIAGAVEPGTYEFTCTIHPQMTGHITVVA